MGFFSKKKKQDNNYLEKLKELDIDFYAYSHDDLEPVELTIDDELNNIEKISDKLYEDEELLFNYTSLTTNEKGLNELSLSKQITSERDIRDKVNLICSVLGVDETFNVDFEAEDLEKIRSGETSNLRRWTDVDGYTIVLSYGGETLGLYIF